MSYLLPELLAPLLLVSVVCSILGWVARTAWERSSLLEEEPATDVERKLQEQMELNMRLRDDLDTSRMRLRDLDGQLTAREPERRALEAELARRNAALRALEKGVENGRVQLAANVEALERSRAELKSARLELEDARVQVALLEEQSRQLRAAMGARPEVQEDQATEPSAQRRTSGERRRGRRHAMDDDEPISLPRLEVPRVALGEGSSPRVEADLAAVAAEPAPAQVKLPGRTAPPAPPRPEPPPVATAPDPPAAAPDEAANGAAPEAPAAASLPPPPARGQLTQALARERVTQLAGMLSDAEGDVDDLERIKGIGPKTCQTLQELGFTTFRQLALVPDQEVEIFAKAIRSSAAKIRRGDWMAQARTLHRLKTGESLT